MFLLTLKIGLNFLKFSGSPLFQFQASQGQHYVIKMAGKEHKSELNDSDADLDTKVDRSNNNKLVGPESVNVRNLSFGLTYSRYSIYKLILVVFF